MNMGIEVILTAMAFIVFFGPFILGVLSSLVYLLGGLVTILYYAVTRRRY